MMFCTPVAPAAHSPLVSCFASAVYPSAEPKHCRYLLNLCVQEFNQQKGRNEPGTVATPRAGCCVIPQPYAAIYGGQSVA